MDTSKRCDPVRSREVNESSKSVENESLALKNGKISTNRSTSLEEYSLYRFVNEIVLPITIMAIVPNFGILLWYTSEKCDGSLTDMYRILTKKSLLEGLLDMWRSSIPKDGLIPCVVLGFMTWSVILMKILPGRRVEGPVTANGNIPVYKDNGFLCYIVTMSAFVVLTIFLKSNGMTPTVIYDRFDEVMLFLNAFSVIFCFFLYVKGRNWPSSTDSGHTGSFIFDYYWGTELYPRVLGIDIKVFTNCRFGLTVWPLLVLLHTLKSFELYGFVNNIFISSCLQMVYLTKFFWWEAGYMQTLDIILDRAGFYICWGCLVLVPSLYTSVSMYMVKHPVHIEPITAFIILAIGLASIFVNYMADLQKQTTRYTRGNCTIWGQKPKVIKAKYRLASGVEKESLLLVSGWWRVSRHFNYLAELVLVFMWTVPTMSTNFTPYAYLTFLTVLLIHRSFRDERKCSNKYGHYWEDYCRKVPYRIVPYLI